MTTVAEVANKIGAELYDLEMQMRAAALAQRSCDIIASARGRLQMLAQHHDGAKELSALKKEADTNLKARAEGEKAEAEAAKRASVDARTQVDAARLHSPETDQRLRDEANANRAISDRRDAALRGEGERFDAANPSLRGDGTGAAPEGFNWPAGTPGRQPNAPFPAAQPQPYDPRGIRTDQPHAPGVFDRAPAPQPFPPVSDASKLDPDAKHPGDPSFAKPNSDFKDPNAVNLNKDGTLKQAPNTLGTTDERDAGKK